jgi:GGDEF domain-containing protein
MNINELSKEQLHALVQALAINDGFGCYTRAGFEKYIWPQIATRAKWIIYFDVDGMHNLNEAYGGYEAVDAMLRQVLSVVRATDYVAGQWKSGDEFLIALIERDQNVPCDPQGMVDRLMDALRLQGLSATFAIVPVFSKDLAVNVKPAVDRVYLAKKSNNRGGLR